MSPLRILPMLSLLWFFEGCVRSKKTEPTVREAPSSLRETSISSVTPTTDGGAYIAAVDNGLWYVRGVEAVKVKFIDTSEAPVDFFAPEITPLFNGGAYAHSVLDNSIWLLSEGSATKVQEVAALSNQPRTGSVGFFPMYVIERQQRKEAESKIKDASEEDE